MISVLVLCVVCLFGLLFSRLDTDLITAWWRWFPASRSFEDKVVWITGASQGLGRLLALHFAEKGAKLILSSRNEQKLKEVAEECKGKKGVVVLPFDMQKANWDEIATEGLSSFPEGVDFVIHNTGLSQHSAAVETKPSVVDDIFQINTVGPIALTQALLPGMLKQKKGQFVVVASMAAKIPSPGQAVYAATKFALLGYFHTLRTELTSSGIGVSVCCPGPFIDSSGKTTRVVFGKAGLEEEEVKRKSGIASQRLVESIALAAHHNIAESWIAQHPVLLLAYLIQYFPLLGFLILETIGPKRARKTGTSESYSMSGIWRKSKKP